MQTSLRSVKYSLSRKSNVQGCGWIWYSCSWRFPGGDWSYEDGKTSTSSWSGWLRWRYIRIHCWFEASLPAGFGFAAAYKGEELDNGIRKVTQDSYSIIGQYWNKSIKFKLGYAANSDSETNGSKDANTDSDTIGQLMAVHNGFVPLPACC